MGSRLIVVSLLLASGWAQAQSNQCATLVPPSIPVRPTLVPALAPELALPSHQLGAPTGVLSQAFDESQSVDQVLFRLRVEGCTVANALPAPTPASGIIDPATYKPKTEFDNTPWRFNIQRLDEGARRAGRQGRHPGFGSGRCARDTGRCACDSGGRVFNACSSACSCARYTDHADRRSDATAGRLTGTAASER